MLTNVLTVLPCVVVGPGLADCPAEYWLSAFCTTGLGCWSQLNMYALLDFAGS